MICIFIISSPCAQAIEITTLSIGIGCAAIAYPSRMTGGICIIYRRIVDVRIPVVPLHPARDNRIGLGKAVKIRVIPARTVVLSVTVVKVPKNAS